MTFCAFRTVYIIFRFMTERIGVLVLCVVLARHLSVGQLFDWIVLPVRCFPKCENCVKNQVYGNGVVVVS